MDRRHPRRMDSQRPEEQPEPRAGSPEAHAVPHKGSAVRGCLMTGDEASWLRWRCRQIQGFFARADFLIDGHSRLEVVPGADRKSEARGSSERRLPLASLSTGACPRTESSNPINTTGRTPEPCGILRR